MNNNEQLTWNEIQIDALTEIMNLGIGVAASSLSEMVDEEVEMNIPLLRVVSRQDVSKELSDQCPDGMSYVFQDFSGSFSGRSALLFPVQQSFSLVKALLKDVIIDDDLTEMEREALSEVGNVILNACIATLVNTLEVPIEVEIPQYVRGGAIEMLIDGDPELIESPTNLFCAVTFKTVKSGIEGYVVFLLGLKSAKALQESVEDYIQQVLV